MVVELFREKQHWAFVENAYVLLPGNVLHFTQHDGAAHQCLKRRLTQCGIQVNVLLVELLKARTWLLPQLTVGINDHIYIYSLVYLLIIGVIGTFISSSETRLLQIFVIAGNVLGVELFLILVRPARTNRV